MYLSAALAMMLVDDMEQLIVFIGRTYSMQTDDAIRMAGMNALWVTCKHSFVFVLVAAFVGVAAIIRHTAMEEGIPIMENIPLARRLYAETKAEEFIPAELVQPVAEVLKWVKRLDEAKKEQAELESVEI